jgi:hypothetical protein
MIVQETLEEAFKKYSEYLEDFENKNTYEHGFKDGAKWQQKNSYSGEEVLKLLINFSDDRTFLKKDIAVKWFEQFKNK